jgi:hypothetical protein
MRTSPLLATLLLASGAIAQAPDKFTNLQVFPKDITRAQLLEEMKRFSFATGYRCDDCHAARPGGAGPPDFASDAKEIKRTARAMLLMVRAINGDHLAKLGRADVSKVECATCHRGIPKPTVLDTLLGSIVKEKGVEAAVARYRELRGRWYGSAAYDFSEKALNVLSQRLLLEGRAKDAQALVELNLEHGAKGSWTHTLLSDASLAAGDKPGAIAALKKALEIEPSSDWTRKKLEELEKAAP